MDGREFLYFYRVETVISNYDGDTIDVLLDLGLYHYQKVRLRLYGVDTPELRGQERQVGLQVRDYVAERLSAAENIVVQTMKDQQGKYGRWLARIYVDGTDLNQELLDLGYAEPYS